MYVRTLGSRTGRAHVVSCWPGAGEILRVRVRENVHGECRGHLSGYVNMSGITGKENSGWIPDITPLQW